jgi:hypothetical protein
VDRISIAQLRAVMFALAVMAVVFIGKRLPADRLPAVAR